MEQRNLGLLCILEGPKHVETSIVKSCTTYREVCRMAWQLRVIKNLTLKLLAERAGLTYQHVTDYFNADDKPTRRDLPAKHVATVEYVLGNTLISQWLAMKAGLTVVEEMQANIQAERKAA